MNATPAIAPANMRVGQPVDVQIDKDANSKDVRR